MSLITVASYRFRHEAEIARGFLADSGIRAIVSADDAGAAYPHLLILHPVRLLVAEQDVEQARELLEDAERQEFDDIDSTLSDE